MAAPMWTGNPERWRYNFRVMDDGLNRRIRMQPPQPAESQTGMPQMFACPVSRRIVIAMLPSILVACSAQKEVLRISSDGDELAFVPSRLDCTAGAQVELILTHKGVIVSDPHDWVLLKPGTIDAFLKLADKATNDDGITDQNRRFIIARTKLCPKGQTVSLTFTAPPAGEYPFVCSVPGHGETMHGTLTTH